MTTIPVGRLEMSATIEPGRPVHRLKITINRADPIIQVTSEWLALVVKHAELATMWGLNPCATLIGGVLTLYPCNRDLIIYREVAYDEQLDVYTFAWPD